MLRDLDGVVSPWAAASPFGLDAERCPGLDAVALFAETGAKWMRTRCAPRAVVEPARGRFTFPPDLDRLIEAWHDSDVQMVSVLDPLGPSRSGPSAWLPRPTELEAYAEYVHATVEHYRGLTKHWEIPSDPGGRRRSGVLPDAYLELLRSGCRAAKAADPACTVVAGLPGTGRAFLERLLGLDAARHMDVLAIDLGETLPEGLDVAEGLAALGHILGAHCPELPTWVTAAGGDGLSPAQGGGLVRLHALCLAAGVQRVLWKRFQGEDPSCLVGSDLAARPAFAAYRTMTRLLEGADCRGQVSAPHGVIAVAFAKHQQDLLLCWAREGQAEVELLGTDIARWDAGGQALRLADGPIRTILGSAPLYAVGHNLGLASR